MAKKRAIERTRELRLIKIGGETKAVEVYPEGRYKIIKENKEVELEQLPDGDHKIIREITKDMPKEDIQQEKKNINIPIIQEHKGEIDTKTEAKNNIESFIENLKPIGESITKSSVKDETVNNKESAPSLNTEVQPPVDIPKIGIQNLQKIKSTDTFSNEETTADSSRIPNLKLYDARGKAIKEEIAKTEIQPPVSIPSQEKSQEILEIPKVEKVEIDKDSKPVENTDIDNLKPAEIPLASKPNIDDNILDVPKIGIENLKIEKENKEKEDKETQKIQSVEIPVTEIEKVPNIENKDILQKTKPKLKLNEIIKKPIKLKERDMAGEIRDDKEIDIDEELEKRLARILEKQKFNENITQAAQFANDTAKKINDLSVNITKLNNDLEDIKNSFGTVCNGVDCIKNDVENVQQKVDNTKKDLDENINKRFEEVGDKFNELGDRVKKIEDPEFMCDNCGEAKIHMLDSFCPNCGNQIPEWIGDDGRPLPGWKPYWQRIGHPIPTNDDRFY